MFNYTNMFKVLADDEDDFEDILPYNKVLDGKWTCLEPSPTAKIINERFSFYYHGKLTWREINLIKEKMDKYEKKINEYTDEVSDNRRELFNSIKEQMQLCNEECAKKLKEHIDICDAKDGYGKLYKCKKDYLAYDCRFKENGRCSHYYEIKYLNQRLEDIEYYEDELTNSYLDYKVEYERALAIKENRYEEYIRKVEEYFD